MIIWNSTPEGYLECFVGDTYSVVGLLHHNQGWSARIQCKCGAQTAPALYHTAYEAKAWIETRVHDRCG